MSNLTGKQKRFLRARANTLDPAVMVGKQGLTETLIRRVDESLAAHELIKVKFIEHKKEKQELLRELTEETGSQLAGVVGHVAALYRPHPDPEKRTIRLPEGAQ